MDVVLLIVGLAGLWFGTEVTIRGAVSVANRFGVSEFIIGVAVLSVGSDLPELAIAVDAGLKNLAGGNFSDVVVGSALGSSLGQIGFVLGVAGLMSYLTLPKKVIFQHGSILLGSLVLVGLFGYDGKVTAVEGVALIVFYCIYLIALLTDIRGGGESEEIPGLRLGRSLLYLLIGLVVVVASAELTVSSAVAVAERFGVSEAVVAIVLIGMGSSLPELTISVGAVLRGHTRMSVGNLVGSNVFDTLIPIGVAAVIAPLRFDEGMLKLELPYLFFVTAVVLVFFVRKRGIQRWEAAFVLALYCGYVFTKVTGSLFA